MTGPPRPPQTPSPAMRVGVLVVAGVLLIGAALWAGSNGPWTARPQGPRTTPQLPDVTLTGITLPTLPTIAPPPPQTGSSWDPSVILYVLGGILLIALLLMLAAKMNGGGGRTARRQQKPSTSDHVEPAPPALDPDRPFDTREAADYVIACWDQLERHAAARGTGRRREQTPTEFMDSVRSTYRIDPKPAGELLALYQRARFDHVRLQPDTAVRARLCFEQISNSMTAAWTSQ